MKATCAIGVVIGGIVVTLAGQDWKNHSVESAHGTAGHHRRSWIGNLQTGYWLPGYKPLSERATLFTRATYVPGMRMGTAFQASSAPPVYTFSDPLAIRNPWLPLATLVLDVLDGLSSGQTDHIERRTLPGKTKTFMINGQPVQAL